MNNIPLIRQLEPWRAMVSSLVALGIALGLSGVAVYVLNWRVMQSSFGSVVAVAFAINVAHVILLRMVARRLLRSTLDALQAIGQGDYDRAIHLYEQHLAFLGRHPWLEKWRTVLWLDQSKIGWTEAARVNIADCHIRLGNVEEAVENYRLCLSAHPNNVMALHGINLLNLFTGQPFVPEYDLEYRYAFDPGQRGMATWVPRIIVYLLAAVSICPLSMLSLFVAGDSVLILALPWLVFVVFVLGFPPAYRWGAFRLFLPELELGLRHVRQGDYAEAAEAFQRLYDVLTVNPLVDRWRIVLLLDPGAYSYREWALLYQVMPYVHLGRRDKVIALYEECLKMNPVNVYAHAGLELVRKLEAVTGQPAADPAAGTGS